MSLVGLGGYGGNKVQSLRARRGFNLLSLYNLIVGFVHG